MVDVRTEQNKKLKKINEKKILSYIINNDIPIKNIRLLKDENLAVFPESE